jgi:hypothetical protein
MSSTDEIEDNYSIIKSIKSNYKLNPRSKILLDPQGSCEDSPLEFTPLFEARETATDSNADKSANDVVVDIEGFVDESAPLLPQMGAPQTTSTPLNSPAIQRKVLTVV